MKAILVIDIPVVDSAEIDEYSLEADLHISPSIPCTIKELDIWLENQAVRPMPLKRETQVAWRGIGGVEIPTHEPSEYDKGWNDCVDFLEGEENE